ncbi:MAG TPA: ABC transporter ATP-binding protein [Alphaproteobacteria bacterium]|nr:ABC transporter ATP-binding protein [Alphaproteobacteria bacterium]HAJ47338.1 ABC transporter ATP-binding protein [Alphaproteobacteria bacterium]
MSNPNGDDPERNSLSGRLSRYARVGAQASVAAAKFAGSRALGSVDHKATAADLKAMLGGLKGPMMKVAQMLATIPEALPEEYAQELMQLQAAAPAMGWPFVRRRMMAELGADWERKFHSFEREAAAAASLGQVHRAVGLDGAKLAAKLQYPDMASAVEADVQQLKLLLSVYKRMDKAIDPSDMVDEIGARLREELDYFREAAHIRLYSRFFEGHDGIRIPQVVDGLSTKRLLTMNWLDGRPMLSFKDGPLADRNRLATQMFQAWWLPFANLAVIHGDPHLGNYTVAPDLALNLLDYGCIRTFNPNFVGGVVDLYHAMLRNDGDLAVHAFETWGFKGLSRETIETLSIWARFIYAPMLEDRVRTIANGVEPGQYGRREAFEVHSRLRKHGPVKPPREFVFMDRAAIGLGGVFLHLGAELNFHTLFNQAIDGFRLDTVAARQQDAFAAAGVPLPQ